MAVCYRCKEEKGPEYFGRCSSRPNGLSGWCKACRAAYNRNRYEKDKTRYSDGNKKKADAVTALIRERKDVPCTDCGQRFHFCAMDFDHIDGAEKLFSVGRRRGTMDKMLVEIAKCEVVCSNCHRVRTWKRRCGITF